MRAAVAGVLAAIAITTWMDATGLSMFSALPLLGLTGLFWLAQRLSRAEMGLAWGRLRDYGLAMAHPLVVLGLAIAIVYLAGQADTSAADWRKTWLNLVAGSTVGVLGTLLTEEGFFRGWLWGALQRAGMPEPRILVWTSVAFSLWHVSAVTLETGFDLPAAQVPVYLLNVVVIGAIWGGMRWLSGSVLVPSVCHAVWNGIVYPLFGFGRKTGALGVADTQVYGPEVGFVGLALSVAFALAMWRLAGSWREG